MLIKRLFILLSISLTCSLGLAGGNHQHSWSADDKEDMKKVQRALQERGYNVDVTGVFGTETSNALHSFQLNKEIQPTHELDPQTLAALGLISDDSAQNQEGVSDFSRAPASIESNNRNAISHGMGIPTSSLEPEHAEDKQRR